MQKIMPSTNKETLQALPLAGMCVLDLCEGPRAYCGRLLCDLGAEVVKLEAVDGEPGRSLPPLVRCADGTEQSLSFLFFNAGKRSACVRFDDTNSLVVLDDFLKRCDVVLDDVEPSSERAALRDSVRHRMQQRGVVWTSLTGWGASGGMQGEKASDLTLLAHGGLLSLAGAPGHEPLAAYGGQAWLALASFGALATMGALFRRLMSGQGACIDVSAVEAVAHSLENAAQFFDLENVVRRRTGHKTEAATGVFACQDGWVYLFTFMGGTVFNWPQLVDWLEEAGTTGASALRDARWQDVQWRKSAQAKDAFEKIFTAFTCSRSQQSLFEEGQRCGVIIGAVNTPVSLVADPALRDRAFFRPMDVPGLGEVSFPGSPYRFSAFDVAARGAAPALGEFTSTGGV